MGESEEVTNQRRCGIIILRIFCEYDSQAISFIPFRFVYFFLGGYYIAPKFSSIYILYSANRHCLFHLLLPFDCLIRIFYYIQHIFYCRRYDLHINAFTCRMKREKKTLFNTNNLREIFSSKTFLLLHFHCESHFRLTDEKIEMKKKRE